MPEKKIDSLEQAHRDLYPSPFGIVNSASGLLDSGLPALGRGAMAEGAKLRAR